MATLTSMAGPGDPVNGAGSAQMVAEIKGLCWEDPWRRTSSVGALCC